MLYCIQRSQPLREGAARPCFTAEGTEATSPRPQSKDEAETRSTGGPAAWAHPHGLRGARTARVRVRGLLSAGEEESLRQRREGAGKS